MGTRGQGVGPKFQTRKFAWGIDHSSNSTSPTASANFSSFLLPLRCAGKFSFELKGCHSNVSIVLAEFMALSRLSPPPSCALLQRQCTRQHAANHFSLLGTKSPRCCCVAIVNRRHEDAPAEARADAEQSDDKTPLREDAATSFALSLLGLYRSWISPLLPNSCRYLPSCSVYGQQAFTTYGFAGGFALLAWRVLRCNPLNGNSIEADPPSAWAQRWGLSPRPKE